MRQTNIGGESMFHPNKPLYQVEEYLWQEQRSKLSLVFAKEIELSLGGLYEGIAFEEDE
jgi:hypothetical protein